MGGRICGEPGCGAALYPGDEDGLCFTCAARGRTARRAAITVGPAAPPKAEAPRERAPVPSSTSRGSEPAAVVRPPAARDAVPPPPPRPARPPAPSARSRAPEAPKPRKPRAPAAPQPCEGPGCERVVTGHRPSVLCPSCAARKRAAEQRARRAEASPEPPVPMVCAEPGCDTPVKRSTTGYCASHAASHAAKRRPRIRPTVCQHRGCEAPISRWSKSGRCRRHALRVRLEETAPAS